MIQSKRLLALIMSTLLMGTTVCTPVMAAEIPKENAVETGTEEIPEEITEEASAANMDAISEDDSVTTEEDEENPVENAEDKIESVDQPSQEEEAKTVQEPVSQGAVERENGDAPEEEADQADGQQTQEEIISSETEQAGEQDAADIQSIVETVSDEDSLQAPGDPSVESGFAEARPISAGDSIFVSVSENKMHQFFKFTPSQSGGYTFHGETDDALSTAAVLYDEEGNELARDDYGSGDNGQFKINANLDEGSIYYLMARTYDWESVNGFTVYVDKINFFAEEEEQYVSARIGEKVTLKVNAYSDLPLEITWYDCNATEVKGLNALEYTLTPDKAGDFFIRCEVTDGTNSAYLSYSLDVSNYVEAEESYKKVSAKAGEEITLKVNAHAGDGSELAYTWYDADYNVIKGQTGSQYKFKPDHSGRYECKVTALDGEMSAPGEYETMTYVTFDVVIENDLVVYPEGAKTDSDGNKEHEVSLNFKKTDNASLKVIVKANDKNGLQYTWYKQIAHGAWGWPTDDLEKINNSGNTLALSNPKSGTYECWVEDRFGNKEKVSFKVLVENGNNLAVFPEGAGTTGGKKDKYVRLPAKSSGTTTFKAIATANDLSGIHYEWYRGYFDESGWNREAEFSGKNTITVKNDDYSRMYKCVVEDKYGNHDIAYFELVKNNLRLQSANGDVEHECDNVSYITVTKTAGEDLTLRTIATAEDTSKITYIWSVSFDDFNDYGISSTDSYVVKRDYPARYTCEVEDGYYNHFILEYNVISACDSHTYGDWTVTKEATCIEEGSRERVCSVCGHKETETISVKSHTWKKDYTIDQKATCIEEGSKSIHCAVCDAIKEGSSLSIPKSDEHVYGGWTVIKAATDKETGLREKVCKLCGSKVKEIIPVLTGTWRKNSKGWWYQWSDGSYPVGRFLNISGKTYYFKADSYMATGWQKIDGKWYYFAAGGAMQTDWQKISGKWYYFNGSGVMQTGWQNINGTWYYFAAGGAMQTGWQKINGSWYYFAAGGAMQTGWQKIGGKWYYFAAGGAMQTGWQKISDKWYYFAAGGAMEANKWVGSYYLGAGGAMATNTWIGKYYVGADGKWIPGYGTRSTSGGSSSGGTSSSTFKGIVYWVSGGSVYHRSKTCPSLGRSSNIKQGTIEESGKSKACQNCFH